MEQQHTPWYPQQHWANQLAVGMTQMLAAAMLFSVSTVSRVMLQQEWLPEEDRDRLARKYGWYEVRHAESMVPSSAGADMVEAACKYKWNSLRRRYDVGLTPKTKAPRVKKEKAVAITVNELNELIGDANEFVGLNHKLPEAEDIQAWSDEKFGKAVSDDAVKRILDTASRNLSK